MNIGFDLSDVRKISHLGQIIDSHFVHEQSMLLHEDLSRVSISDLVHYLAHVAWWNTYNPHDLRAHVSDSKLDMYYNTQILRNLYVTTAGEEPDDLQHTRYS